MKTTISIARCGRTDVRSSIEQALLKIPDHWKRVLPDIHFTSVAFEHLPRSFQKVWGLGASNPGGMISRKWSVRVKQPLRHKPWEIKIWLSEGNDSGEEYMFERNILSSIFSTILGDKHITETITEVKGRCNLRHPIKAHTVLIGVVPSFLMSPEIAEVTQPELCTFFPLLEKEITRITQS